MEREPEIDTHKRVKAIFKQTYFLSQGAPYLQRLLFRWLANEKIVTLEEIEETPKYWLRNFYAPRNHKEAGQKSNTEWGDPMQTWYLFISVLKNKTNDKDLSPTEVENLIYSKMLVEEAYYQIRGRQGRNVNKSTQTDDANDPYKSFLRTYILEDNFTTLPFAVLLKRMQCLAMNEIGHIQINQIPQHQNLEEMDKDDFINWLNEQTNELLMAITIYKWEQNHPGEKFFK